MLTISIVSTNDISIQRAGSGGQQRDVQPSLCRLRRTT
jgi:hypothetical protein